MQSLAKVQAGESCEIKWMFGNADVMNFLERYGIKEGSRIRVLGRVLDGLIIGNGKVGWHWAMKWQSGFRCRFDGD